MRTASLITPTAIGILERHEVLGTNRHGFGKPILLAALLAGGPAHQVQHQHTTSANPKRSGNNLTIHISYSPLWSTTLTVEVAH